MNVDIWSDIRCPFCYIGKRKFELALERFPEKDHVTIEWHSFQLDPGLKTRTDMDVYDYLAGHKGMSRKQSEDMHRRVAAIAHDAGLQLNFDRVVVANSFNAHRLIQLAKSKALGGEAEERLFRAHFTEGRNIDDAGFLLEAGVSIGLSSAVVSETIATNAFAESVQQDEMTARYLGITAVPFFILDKTFAVSGAQSPDVFLQTLQRAWAESQKEKRRVVR